MKTLGLKPFVSAGEVFMHEDGETFEVAPLSLFQLEDGQVVLRIGRNTYWFDPDGNYDGPECVTPPVPGASSMSDEEIIRRSNRRFKPLMDALTQCKQHRNQRPKMAYFETGTPGYRAETAIWPKQQRTRKPRRK